MKNQRTLTLLAITAAFMLGGCAGMSRQEVSTVTGAAVGAVAGAAVGGPIATVGGALLIKPSAPPTPRASCTGI